MNKFLTSILDYPPLKEQIAILRFIEKHTSSFIDTEKFLRRSIVLLKERRSALITAAVTGQLESQALRA